ncbi:sensor histidine kinase [Geoalkalibacter sp.]|uniref:sensor histidine kinase n=1 Tax=Geoalkalibacter sp. TaxID=3041440 RepID=UPI00272E479A|nr:ATP-binding protein [Geoalkalibacter sp.]
MNLPAAILLSLFLALSLPATPCFSQGNPTFGYEMFERHGAVMLLIDPAQGTIIDANRAAADFYGYSLDELRRMRIQQINTLSEAQTRQEWELASKESRNYFIFRHRLANGEIRPVEVYSWPITVNGRAVLFSIIHDVSGRETLQQALVESEVRLRQAERVAGVGHWTLDLGRGTYTFSEGAREILGLTGESWAAKDILALIPPDDRKLMEQSRHGLVERGDEYNIKVRFQRPSDGKILDLHSQGFFDPKENLLFGVIHDLTDYTQAMRTLKSRTWRFTAVVSVFVVVQFVAIGLLARAVKKRRLAEQALLEREARLKDSDRLLREKNAELERFTYTVSHDLKSPLVTIQTFLGYLRQDLAANDAVRLDKDVAYIDAAAQRMTLLLDELREFSQVGRVVNEPLRVSFAELTQEALGLVAGRISARGVQVRTQQVDLTLVGDRPRLVALWQNLLENAVKYMGDQAQPLIEVGVDPTREETVFFVRDNGMGIEPRHQEKIFELFKRVDTGGEGTGFGLALVKRIVEVHGGRIWVESEGLGKGSCFFFSLPAAEKYTS